MRNVRLDRFLILRERRPKRPRIEVVEEISFQLPRKRIESTEEIVPPWLDDCVEAGYLVIPKKLSVHVGSMIVSRLLWVRLLPEWASKIRLGFPLLIYDLIHGEYIAGVIKMMGYDVAWHELVDRDVMDARGILTSEMLECGDTEFLELVPLVGVDPLCSLKKTEQGIVRGGVTFAPHIRAPAYLPSQQIINVIYGLPDEGPAYGVLMFGEEAVIDPKNGKFIGYRMREEILFEHELVTGTTGKGKTAKCKNDIYCFIKHVKGAVVVIDTHNEYSMVADDPIKEDDPIKPNDVDVKMWEDLGLWPTRIEDAVIWAPHVRGSEENIEAEGLTIRPFTIMFRNISPSMLQYYLPALSPQGYYVLPKLVNKFRMIYRGKDDTLEKFYRWLENVRLPRDMISEATREAILRRLAAVLEEGIFDSEGVEDISIAEMLKPGRVNIIRVDIVPSVIARRILVMHVISMIARAKLEDYAHRHPPTMLLIDEAHNYFPRFVYDLNEREWVIRTVSWVERIAREGRKFRLRIEFSTQSPEDLNPRILKTVNTYTIFGLTPLQIRTLRKFMELPVDKTVLMNLPTRCAVVYSRGNSIIPLKILVPWSLLRHKITKKLS